MHIEHIALWTKDLEKLRAFYVKYFNAASNEKYVNHAKSFQSYFLSFAKGARLELMQMPGIVNSNPDLVNRFIGLAHFAIAVGSEENVNELTNRLRDDGYRIVGEPRVTGDGYYESVILDPDGNRIEITI